MSKGRPFAGLVHEILGRAEASYSDRAHLVWEVWERALGPDLARRSYPVELRRGRLLVAGPNAAWVQQLSFLREQIRQAVNRALGEELVREVRLRVAEIDPPKPRPPAAPPAWLDEPVGAPVLAAIADEVATIADPELREAIRQVRLRAEQVSRYRERLEDPGAPGPLPSTRRPGRGGAGAT
jgi:hypothetical protein